MCLFLITRGQFSAIDLLLHCLREMGPSRVSVWTWVIADYEMELFKRLKGGGQITEARLIIDRAGASGIGKMRATSEAVKEMSERHQSMIASWVAIFGPESLKICTNHAKITTIDNGRLRLVIRGSMNLNGNPRCEQADISEGRDLYDFVRGLEDAFPVLNEQFTAREVAGATFGNRVVEVGQLALFNPDLQAWGNGEAVVR